MSGECFLILFFSLYAFQSSELARERPEGVTFCEGIVCRLPLRWSQQGSSTKPISGRGKSPLKSLGDLRKSLAEETQKILLQSREQSSALWEDWLWVSTRWFFATVWTQRKRTTSRVCPAFCALALYIAISYRMSVSINRHALSLLEKKQSHLA